MSELLDSWLCPEFKAGHLMHIIMAKAVAFGEAFDDPPKLMRSK